MSASGQAAALHGTDDGTHVGATRAWYFPGGEQEEEGDYFGVGMIERHEREEDLPRILPSLGSVGVSREDETKGKRPKREKLKKTSAASFPRQRSPTTRQQKGIIKLTTVE